MLKNTQWESSLTAYTMKIIATLIHTEVLHNPPSVLQPESKNIAHVFSFLRYTDAFIKLSACLYSSFSIFTYSTSLSVHPVLFSLRDQQTFIFCFPLQDQNRRAACFSVHTWAQFSEQISISPGPTPSCKAQTEERHRGPRRAWETEWGRGDETEYFLWLISRSYSTQLLTGRWGRGGGRWADVQPTS